MKQRLDTRRFKPSRAEIRSMERLLDEHMPTGKSGRGPVLWTLIGLLSGIAVSGFYLGFQEGSASAPSLQRVVLEREEGSSHFRSNQDATNAAEVSASSSTGAAQAGSPGVVNEPEAGVAARPVSAINTADADPPSTTSFTTGSTTVANAFGKEVPENEAGEEFRKEDIAVETNQLQPALPETEDAFVSFPEELLILPSADPFSPIREKPVPIPHTISPEIPVRQFFRFLTGWSSLSSQAIFSGSTYEVDLRLEKPVGRGQLGLGIGYGRGEVELADGGTWEFSETSFWQVDTTGFVYQMDSVWVIDSINLGHWGYYPVDTLALTDSTKQIARDSTLRTTRLVSQVYLPLHYDLLFSRGRWQFRLGAEATFSRLSYTLGEGEGQLRENLQRYTVGARLGVSYFLTANFSAGALWRPRYLIYSDPKFLSGWQPGAVGVSLRWHF